MELEKTPGMCGCNLDKLSYVVFMGVADVKMILATIDRSTADISATECMYYKDSKASKTDRKNLYKYIIRHLDQQRFEIMFSDQLKGKEGKFLALGFEVGR